jgi:4-hydroxy-4-methyl-2-oxoglutarate aldolase
MDGRLADDRVNEILELGAATLYEASKIDCNLSCDIRPAWAGATVCGPALPVVAAPYDNLPLHLALEVAHPGEVLVVDAGGVPAGYWGEVLTIAALHRSVVGLVIDGGVRDTDALARHGFGAFSRSISVRGTVKSDAGKVGEPMVLGGVPVRRGDLVVGDADGAIVLPAERVDEILQLARQRHQGELGYMDRIRNGESTVDIYGLPRP